MRHGATHLVRGHDGLPRRPSLEDDEAEGLVTARHNHDVASLEELRELRAGLWAEEAAGAAHAELLGAVVAVELAVPVADEDDLRVAMRPDDARHGLGEHVRALHPADHAAHEEHQGIQGADAVAALDLAGVDEAVEAGADDAVGDGPDLGVRDGVDRRHLRAQLVAHGDEAVGHEGRLAFPSADIVLAIALAPAGLCGVEREDAGTAVRVLALHHGLAGHPIVSVADVEAAHAILCAAERPCHRVAHVGHGLHETFARRC
mmetsp:Transcript_94575/g.264816  ORF Transcript_94575/g.264816 Transcript_94575/m.264816 type:complete len:261 (-) Transcript_94575:252-1034(-)